MRESRGRTASSKRPLSSCSMSPTSAWKRRPFLSTSTMSPGPIALDERRAAGEDAGGSAGRSISWAWFPVGTAGKLASGPDGAGHRVPDAAMQDHVLLAVAANLDDRALGRVDGAPDRPCQLPRRFDALVPEPVQLRRQREVQARRGGDVLGVGG